ncbi:YitT family protein [Anaerophaga thermohalophila]|uniref:YitT family protein n=1 Tax=Anaerophaga thermohalophila TaxID=177400 RepID=UPI000319FB61|nr:YitT family protein [Anaerophaga thermohalophila]
MNREYLWREIRSYIIITAGLAMGSIGWTGFIIPSEIVGGGLTGISSILFFLFDIDVGLSSLLINAALILIAIKSIGASFGIKTIYSVVVFSGFLSFFSNIFTSEPLVGEKMMAAVTGGILSGIGGGLVFSYGGSAGGTDIIARIINKYYNISMGRLLLAMDAIIIVSAYPIFCSIETMVYGFMTMAVIAYAIDLVISGNKQTVQFFIFSRKHKELAEQIVYTGKKGLTIIPAIGGYTGEEIKVLMVYARKKESSIIFRIIKSVDPEAFITMGNVMGIFGEGYDRLKIREKKRKPLTEIEAELTDRN